MQRIMLEPKQELCKDATKFGGVADERKATIKKKQKKNNNPKSNTVQIW